MIIEESAVWAIIGWRGSGKTALLARIAEIDYNRGKKIVSNVHLSFPHIYKTFEELIELPEDIENATVIFDEFQVGAGARNALRNDNKKINMFITQLRKRNIVLYYTTQNFKFVDIDVRIQTDYILTTEAVDKHNNDDHRFSVKIVDTHDMSESAWGSLVNEWTWDATDLFKRKVYDTKQIINFGEEKEDGEDTD